MKIICCRKLIGEKSSRVNYYFFVKAISSVLLVFVFGFSFVYYCRFNLPRKSVHLEKDLSQEELCATSDFQVVETGSAFLYSAYIDDRPTRDVNLANTSTGAIVRLFAYYLRSLDASSRWKCSFSFKGKSEFIDSPIVGVTNLDKFSSLRFLVAMVLCDLPKTSPDFIPEKVSLRSKYSSSTQNSVCVVDLRKFSSSLSNGNRTNDNRKSINNVSAQNNYSFTFTVCTSPIHGKYYKTEDIVSFIEINRLFGAEKFIFYVDKDLHSPLLNCLEAYREQRIVDLYLFTPPVNQGLHYHGQIISISDCAYRTMYRTKYLINQDLDEVIVPLKTDSWMSLLDMIHSKTQNPEMIASYSFQNQFFPLEAPNDKSTEQIFLVKRYNIKQLLKTFKEPIIYPHGDRSKVMARPERVLMWHVHMILEENVVRATDYIHYTSPVDALLFHYRSLEEKSHVGLLNERRMLKFSDNVTDRIHYGIGLCSISPDS